MAKWLPSRVFQFRQFQFTLNPGPFNQKEHMLITVVAGTTLSGTYTSDIFVTQISPVFFDQSWARSLTYQYLITISMQCIGYGIAGLARASLVYPDYCIWPSTLAVIVFNRSLHESSGYSFKLFGRAWTRYRYFLLIFCLTMVWTVYASWLEPADVKVGPWIFVWRLLVKFQLDNVDKSQQQTSDAHHWWHEWSWSKSVTNFGLEQSRG